MRLEAKLVIFTLKTELFVNACKINRSVNNVDVWHISLNASLQDSLAGLFIFFLENPSFLCCFARLDYLFENVQLLSCAAGKKN